MGRVSIRDAFLSTDRTEADLDAAVEQLLGWTTDFEDHEQAQNYLLNGWERDE